MLSKFLTFFLSFLYLFNIVLEEQKNICLGFHCMKIHKLVLTSKHLFYWQSTLAIHGVLARGLFSRFLHINAMNMFWWCLHVSTIFYFHHFFKNISAVFLPWFVQATLKPLPLLILQAYLRVIRNSPRSNVVLLIFLDAWLRMAQVKGIKTMIHVFVIKCLSKLWVSENMKLW